MRHDHHHGHGRDVTPSDRESDHHSHPAGEHHPGHHRQGGRRGARHGGRLFDYGDLRLLLLAMLAENPRHGYELIKAIEERFGGSYSPSPGVIYPTLSWLEDMGYARVEAEQGNRKRYVVTPEGEAFLVANRDAADELLARGGEGGRRPPMSAPVLRAMQNLKLAMRLRLGQGALDPASADMIAAALDSAAQAVEKS